MKTKIVYTDDDNKVLHQVEITGNSDVVASVRAAVGRAKFEMSRHTDLNWTTATITINRWVV